MFGSLIFSVAVLGITLRFGLWLGEFSGHYVSVISCLWLAIFAASSAMGWPVAVVIVTTVVFAVGTLMLSFGSDISIR